MLETGKINIAGCLRQGDQNIRMLRAGIQDNTGFFFRPGDKKKISECLRARDQNSRKLEGCQTRIAGCSRPEGQNSKMLQAGRSEQQDVQAARPEH
jgi:hypothetical protein